MAARGNMGGHVNDCRVANRNIGQELNSPADTEVREGGGGKILQALV